MTNTVTIGQQHYQWKTIDYPWLNAVECTIHNIIDPEQQLVMVLNKIDKGFCTPQQVKLWINFALGQGWYSEKRVYNLFKMRNQIRVYPVKYSLSDEHDLTAALAERFDKKIASLHKSAINAQLTALEESVNVFLPSIIKQLYLNLGDGDFGPDYGFFALTEHNLKKKTTLNEAYHQVHDDTIKDWDWELPRTLVPFMYWGADIYSMLDCSTTQGGVYVLDKNLKKKYGTWQSCVWQHCPDMLVWLEKWLAGDHSGRGLWLEMYQLKGLISK